MSDHSAFSSPQSALRLVVMGTGPFAVPFFRALYDTRHSILALVTQPPRPAVGKKAPPPSPMRAVADEHGTPIYDPPSINTDEAREVLRGYRPDLFVVADYGQILAPETLAVARLGGINLHGSLLPKYRGAAPINWCIFKGDTESGVTVIQMSPRVDAGGCLVAARTPIDPEETAVDLERRLSELGAPLIVDVVDKLAAGTIAPLPQDQAQATGARRLRKTDGEVDWRRTAREIKNQMRALEPWPRTSTNWLRAGGEPLRVILGRADVVDAPTSAEPGTVAAVGKEEFSIATGGGVLILRELQPAGKRQLSAGEFLRGYPLKVGDRFGAVNPASA
jgi:methionyl-tRNA formyltransferase